MCGNEGFNDPKCKCCPGTKQAEEAIAVAAPSTPEPQPQLQQQQPVSGVNEEGTTALDETVGRCRAAMTTAGQKYYYNSENQTTYRPKQ